MNPRHYIVSVIELLQREFNLYFVVSPRDFDILYRWFEKRIPLDLIRGCVTDVQERRARQGKTLDRVGDLAYAVRKAFGQHQDRSVGAHGTFVPALDVGAQRAAFFDHPPPDIETLVSRFSEGLMPQPPLREAVLEFHRELLLQFEHDEELERRSTLFCGCAWTWPWWKGGW
jgi:hypothetical protein